MAKFTFDKQTLINSLSRAGYLDDDPITRVRQMSSLALLVDFINHDARWQTLPQIAYFLATVAHECTTLRAVAGKRRWVRTYEPVEELGDASYFAKYETGSIGKRLGNVYKGDGSKFRGRGYVQLTGRANYAGLGRVLAGQTFNTGGVPQTITVTRETFTAHPELTLIPRISYLDAASSMFAGRYTGKKITDYISDLKVDYVNARRVINGTDRAEDIAKLARVIESGLRDASQYLKLEKWPPQVESLPQSPSPDRLVPERKPTLAAFSLSPPTQGMGVNSTARPNANAVPDPTAEIEPARSGQAQPATASQGQGTPEVVKVSSWKDHLNGALGYLSGAGTMIAGIFQDNTKLMIAAGCLLALMLVLYFVRDTILQKEKMRINSDPSLKDVK